MNGFGLPWGELLRAPLSKETLATASSLFALAIRPRLFASRESASVQAAREQLRALAEASQCVICLLDGAGVVRALTPNAARILGENSERAAELGTNAAELLQPDSIRDLQDALDDLSRSEPTNIKAWTFKTRSPQGAARYLAITGTNLLFDREVGGLLLEIRDVTQHFPLEQRHLLVGAALEDSPDAVIITNVQGFIEWVNPAFERQTGYKLAEIRGRTPAILRSDRQSPEYYQEMWRVLKTGDLFRGEIVNRRRSGDVYSEDLLIQPVRSAEGTITHYVSIGRDITDRKRLESNAESAIFYDRVTGVSSFKLLRERSRQILALARRHGHTAALLHVDLDGLNAVNSRHGRGVGDELLRKFADRLKQGLRESDTLARLRGDEFLVLLSDVAEEDATARVVRRLRESLGRPFQIRGHSITLGSSVGVALYPQDGTTFDELIECSSLALKRAKTARSGYEFYRQELTELTHERLTLEDDLRWAWERKQFVLHYQPVIALNTGLVIGAEALARGHVVGMEALARWPHMERGQITPAQFIPVAERTGRIVALDRWALATAAKQAAVWSEEGWYGWVSVNLSARSLHDAELPSYLQRCFESHGLQPGRLILEITESAAMRDRDITARILSQLKDAGALIALDDFGVGHSSLAYLKHFPVDVLKLDHNFVHDIGRAAKHEHLIETMITLAHRIGATVVAEAVEQENQLKWLREAGCDFAQGYLIGRPQPPEEVFARHSA